MNSRFHLSSQTLRSRSFWNGLAIMATAMLHVGGVVDGPVFDGAMSILGGLAAIFLRDSLSRMGGPTLPQS